jgi:hypothetical protein
MTGTNPPTRTEKPFEKYTDPHDRFWSLYLMDAEKEDERMTDSWKGNTDGILIFVCVFYIFILISSKLM